MSSNSLWVARAGRSPIVVASAVCSVCVMPALAAAPAPASEPAADVPTVVVTATRTPTPLDEVASSVSVITASDIQRHQWRTVADALQSVPGVNLVQSGGPGSATSVFIRGANSNQTKVLIDGIVANDPARGGAFGFGQILTADIARIEVLRGPQSSLHGSDAIGGVINIITKEGKGPARIHASLEGGSFDTFNQNAGISGATAKFNYAFDVAHVRAGKSAVTPLDLLPPGRQRNDDDYENTTLSTRLGAQLSETVGIDFVARYLDSALDFTTDALSYPSSPAAAQTYQSDRDLYTRIGLDWALFGGRFKNHFGMGYSHYDLRLQSPDAGFGLPPVTKNIGSRVKYSWQGELTLAPGQMLVMGLEDKDDRLDNPDLAASTANKAAYVEIQSRVRRGWFVTASARHDDNQRFGTKGTWKLGSSYTFENTGTELKATYGTGFKAPTMRELLVSYPAFGFYANPDLQPEESTGYDLGFEQPLWKERIRVGATYFHNNIKNLIVTNATGTSLANTGHATTHGVESFVSVSPTAQLTVKLDYTHTIAVDDATGLQLLRRPKDSSSVNLAWTPEAAWSLSANVRYVGSWVDGNRNFTIMRMDAPSYLVADAALSYQVNQGLRVYGRITNLFDRKYEDPIGFLHPERGAFVGIEGSFGL